MGLELVVRLLADASGLAKGTAEGGKSVEAFGKSIDIGGVAKMAAFAGAAGIAVTAIAGLTMAAADDVAEQEKLALAIANATGSTADYTATIDAAIAAGEARAFTDSDVRAGMEALVTATGDVDKATAELAIAQDIARLAGVDLATASDAVAKAHAGSDGALRKLIPGLAKGATGLDTIALASQKASGQAELYGKSTKGSMESSSIAFSELGETIGSAFLPILAEILPAIKPVIQALGEIIKAILPLLIPLLKTAGAILGVVAKAIAAVAKALANVIQWLTKAIGKIGDFVSKLGPLKAAGDIIGGIVGRSVGTVGGSGATRSGAAPYGAAGWSSGSSGGARVVINTWGDPATITAATIRGLRQYDRQNGARQVVPRWY